VDPPQQHGQRVFPPRHGDQVNMVRHQTPTEQADLGVLQVLAHQAKVSLAVRIG
jgi:hypothetical protein